ncbi:MAG TPA: multiheme c-type cytochrome [Acidisarcina sp.]
MHLIRIHPALQIAGLLVASAIPALSANAPRSGYVGDSICLPCHEQQAKSYRFTYHHLTSQPAGKTAGGVDSVLGPFMNGSNVLTIHPLAPGSAQPALFFKMEEKAGHKSVTAFTGWGGNLFSQTAPLDVVTGSGKRGQTYLYWRGDQLFELPVSYWSDGHRWINSPGYTDGTADFSRPVNPGCLECHATYIKAFSSDPFTNSYDRGSLVTGISCETCHGPGGPHVALHKALPGATPAAPMSPSKVAASGAGSPASLLNPAKFSRDRQVDLCALCHNGIQRQALAPAFSYLPGEPLSSYFKPLPVEPLEHPDVHGNQVGLLQRSRCYTSSPSMNCSTCHDVHAPERPATAYSDRCLTCHQWQSCGKSKSLGHAIAKNCIDCHMPVEPTNVIVSETAGQMVRATMRNHWIKIYPGAK